MTSPFYPNAMTPIGGFKMSTSNTSFFTDEVAGDVMIYANNPGQTMRFGQTSNAISTVSITKSALNVMGNINTPDFINSMGITLGLGDSVIYPDLDGVSTVTVNMTAIAASNQAYRTATVASNISLVAQAASNQAFNATKVSLDPTSGAVLGTAFTTPTTFMSNVAFSNGTTVIGMMTIGPNVNVTYPLNVQTISASNVSIYASGDITAFSDRRFKTDVRPIERALSRVNAIGGYTFVRVGDMSDAPKRMAGVLAQEMIEVMPEVVDTEPGSGHMHVAYGNISALLIQAT